MISISEEELIGLLEKAYEEGWYGSKDMGEIVAQTLVADIKQPEYTSSGEEKTRQMLKEADRYFQHPASNGRYTYGTDIPAPPESPPEPRFTQTVWNIGSWNDVQSNEDSNANIFQSNDNDNIYIDNVVVDNVVIDNAQMQFDFQHEDIGWLGIDQPDPPNPQ